VGETDGRKKRDKKGGILWSDEDILLKRSEFDDRTLGVGKGGKNPRREMKIRKVFFV